MSSLMAAIGPDSSIMQASGFVEILGTGARIPAVF